MKTLIPLIFLICLMLPCPQIQADDIWQAQIKADKKLDYILNEASIDIMADIKLWVQLRGEVDVAHGEAWKYTLARKIPSQALGVIEVAARTDCSPDLLCNDPFIEVEDHVVHEWARRSIETLESFTMLDAKKEKIRRGCLEKIKSHPILKSFPSGN